MLRSNGHQREVRARDRLFVSDCAVDSSQTRGCARYVSSMLARPARSVFSVWQKQSNFKNLRRRRRIGAPAVLDAIPCLDQMPDNASVKNGTGTGGRSWCNAWELDQEEAKAGAVWALTPRSLGATGTTGRTPDHEARTGTTLPRTRTTTSGRAASVAALGYHSANATALQVGFSTCGQPALSSFGKYATRSGIASSSTSNGAASIYMPKRHWNLIDQIAHIDNLRLAYAKTSRNKRMTFGYLEFKEYDEANLLLVQQELLDGSYRIGNYREFTIFEPKARLISALEFKDRLVQHALCNVIAPIFERALLPQTFACRVGLGTHAGVKFIQAALRRTDAPYFLKSDFSRFFPSVDHAVLHKMIDRKIACHKTLLILREIIPTNGKGIPIGSLTSQLFANVYGDAVDRFIHFDLGVRNWARYMDDIIVLGNDIEALRKQFFQIKAFSQRELQLKISKWQVSPTSQGINFLGFRIWKTHKLLRHDSVIRAKRKVAKFVGRSDQEALRKFLASWSGHARWADTHNLFTWLENRYGIVS